MCREDRPTVITVAAAPHLVQSLLKSRIGDLRFAAAIGTYHFRLGFRAWDTYVNWRSASEKLRSSAHSASVQLHFGIRFLSHIAPFCARQV